MPSDLRPFLILLLAVEAGAALFWMGLTFRRDLGRFPPPRTRGAIALAVVLMAGFFLYAVLSLLDPKQPNFLFPDAMAMLGKAAVFAVFILAKGYFGPLFVGFTLLATTYNGLQYGEFRPWALVDDLFEWVFSFCPKWVEWIYFSLAFLYTLIATIWDNLTEAALDAGQAISQV